MLENKIQENRALMPANNMCVQYCYHQIGKSDQYRLLKSYPPQKNEPADYSIEIARGTLEQLTKLRGEIRRGIRDEDGNHR